MIDWKELTTISEYEEIDMQSRANGFAFFIFKHSTRCMTSSMAKKMVENEWNVSDVPTYIVDVIRNRDLSNFIERQTLIQHQSPQALLIRKVS